MTASSTAARRSPVLQGADALDGGAAGGAHPPSFSWPGVGEVSSTSWAVPAQRLRPHRPEPCPGAGRRPPQKRRPPGDTQLAASISPLRHLDPPPGKEFPSGFGRGGHILLRGPQAAELEHPLADGRGGCWASPGSPGSPPPPSPGSGTGQAGGHGHQHKAVLPLLQHRGKRGQHLPHHLGLHSQKDQPAGAGNLFIGTCGAAQLFGQGFRLGGVRLASSTCWGHSLQTARARAAPMFPVPINPTVAVMCGSLLLLMLFSPILYHGRSPFQTETD